VATSIGLGVQFTANASGMTKGLSQAEKTIQQLGRQAADASKLFDSFTGSSAAAGAAQQQVATDLAFLSSAFRTGQVSAQEYAAELLAITQSAQTQAAAFAEGARITEQTATAEERRTAQLERLGDLLQQGAIDAEVYGRAVASSTAGFDGTQAERFAQALAPLREQLQSGAISLQEFNQQAGGVADAVSGSTSSAQRSAEAILELKRQLDAGAISIEEYRSQFAEIQAGNISSTLSVEVLGIREGISASDDLQAAIASLKGTQIEAALQIAGVESIDDLRQRFDNVDGRQLDALLQVLGVESLEQARQQLAAIDGTEVLAQLSTAGFESIEEAQSLIDSVEGKDITLLAETLGVESIEQLTAVINAVESRTVEFNVDSNADETAAQVKSLVDEQAAYQQLLSEAARITQKYTSDEERRAAAIAKIEEVNRAGVLSEEIYARAIEDASGAKEEAIRIDQQRAADSARAAQIIEANLSSEERASRDYAASVAELDRLVAAGVLTEADYAKAVEHAAAAFAKATVAAARYEDAADGAGDAGVLKFNELSGVLSALPGPIGNVAGRLSGLSSAGEGLDRVFGGGLTKGLASVSTQFTGLLTTTNLALVGVAAFGAGAAAVANGLVDLEDRVETLGNTADKLGVSFEFIQTIEEAGRRSGVGIESVSSAFGKLQKTLAGADEESKAATAALSKLGVSFSDLENLSPQEQIRLIGEKLQGIEDPAKRTAAAMQIFGKSGADLIPFFNNLTPAADDIERLGRALTEIDRGRIDDFGAGIDALGVATQGLGQTLLLPFVGLGEGISKGAAEFIAGVTAIVDPIAQVLEPALTAIGVTFEIFGVAIGTVGRTLGAVLEPVGAIFQGISVAVDPLLEGATNLARSFSDIAAGVTEFIVSSTPLGVIADNIGAIGDTVGRVAVIIGTAFSQVGEYIGGLVARFGELVAQSPLLESIGGIISKVFGSVSTVFSTISEAIGGVVGRLLTIAEGFLGIEQSANDAGEAAVVALEFTPPEGFADYEKAIQSSRTALNAAIEESAQFGQAGFDAALQFQTALEKLQAQADAGILNETAYKAEVEKATEAYRSQISTIREAQKAEEEKLKAVERAADAVIAADQRRADSFIQSQGLGGEDPRTKAAEDLLAITRQIDEAEAALVQARADSDRAAEQAAIKRLAILDQAEAAAQQKVEFGFTTADANKAIEDTRKTLDEVFTFDNFQLAPDAFTAAQAQLRELTQQLQDNTIDPETYKLAADALRSGFEDAVKDAEKLGELQLKYAEAAAEIDKERLDKLATVSQEPLKIEDVRTSGGASEFLRLASGREDPAVEEYRKQLTKLDEIKKELAKVGGTVEMIGA
jgi:hypothetical protein